MADLVRFEPLRGLLDIRDAFDRLFERSMLDKKLDISEKLMFAPKIEIHDKKKEILVKAELPGIEKNDVEVTVEQGNLVIKGESKKEEEKEEKGYYYSERSYGSFFRSIALPTEIEEEKIKAAYKDGILTITLPKSVKAKEKGKAITVE